ncbi:hypothetical protein JOM56_005117 [Amanita muscaria]
MTCPNCSHRYPISESNGIETLKTPTGHQFQCTPSTPFSGCAVRQHKSPSQIISWMTASFTPSQQHCMSNICSISRIYLRTETTISESWSRKNDIPAHGSASKPVNYTIQADAGLQRHRSDPHGFLEATRVRQGPRHILTLISSVARSSVSTFWVRQASKHS